MELKQNKLQYVSDIHLEFLKPRTMPTILPLCENSYLALCGDIGYPFSEIYEMFIARHSPLFKHIFVVAGNHEYYSLKKQRTMKQIDEKIKEVCSKFLNVTFMNKKSIIVRGVKFLGCSLWSDVSMYAEFRMNDYRNIYLDSTLNTTRTIVYFANGEKKYIKKNRTLIKPVNISQLHKDMVTWIKDEINVLPTKQNLDVNSLDYWTGQIIVLTHHAPSLKMDRNIPDSCYSTNCEFLFTDRVSHWISGHTHLSRQVEINNTICLSNCLGYPRENCVFEDTAHVDF